MAEAEVEIATEIKNIFLEHIQQGNFIMSEKYFIWGFFIIINCFYFSHI